MLSYSPRGMSSVAVAVCVALLAIPSPRIDAAEKAAVLDIEYVPAEAVTAAVVNVRKLKRSPSLELMPWEVLTAAGIQELGFDPLKIEQVLVTAALQNQAPGFSLGAVVSLSSPVTLKQEFLSRAEPILVAGHKAFRFPINPPVELAQVNGKTLVIGTPGFLESMLKSAADKTGAAARSPLRQLIGTQAPTDDIAVFLAVEPLRPMLNANLQDTPPLPPPLQFVLKLPDQLQSLRLNLNLDGGKQVQLVATATDAEAATAIDQGVRGSLGMIKSMFLATTLAVAPGDGQVQQATRSYFTRLANVLEKRMQPKRDGSTVTLEAGMDSSASMGTVATLVALLLPAVQQAREAARRAQSKNNMKQLMLALHNYHDRFGHFPARASYDDNGKPLLSWRVHILPYIDAEGLYKQFKLDEPWDSPHNRPLLDVEMPIFRCPSDKKETKGPRWGTNYVAVVGPETVWPTPAACRFEDVTESAGLSETGFGQGVAVGDIDGDGWPALHVANIGGNRLYLNNGDGTFHDATEAAGLPGDGDASWSTSCVIADINGDGHADIYVVNYLSGTDLFTRVCRDGTGRVRMCQPFQFPSAIDRLYLGRGDGTFRDVTAMSDIGVERGKGLGVVAADLDADGRLELFVANDTRANFLFRAAAEGSGMWLVETGLFAGVGLGGDGQAEGSMGIAVGDADGDGRPDLFVTNFLDETNTLYVGIGRGRFSDRTRRAGLASSSLKTLGFGTQFLDADLDGDLDLLVANGHVDDYSDVGRPYRMATQYYRNRGNGRFDLLDDPAQGPHFRQQFLGRGLAWLDWNRDGRPDAVITALDVPTVLLTNTTEQAGGGLVLRLVATAGHRDAIGARVKLGAGAKARWFELTSGDGYLASNQRCLLIGMGSDQGAVRVEVSWPGRASQVFGGLTCDREWVLVEGRGEAISLARPIERP